MQKIAKTDLAFYRKHPELIQAVGNKSVIYRVVLLVVFVAGFLLVVLSKGVKYGFVDAPDSRVVELVVDLLFEMGVALWGGVATTVLLQNFVERKYAEGRNYQQELIRQLQEEDPSFSVETASPEPAEEDPSPSEEGK